MLLLQWFSQALSAKNRSSRLGANAVAPANRLWAGGHGALFVDSGSEKESLAPDSENFRTGRTA